MDLVHPAQREHETADLGCSSGKAATEPGETPYRTQPKASCKLARNSFPARQVHDGAESRNHELDRGEKGGDLVDLVAEAWETEKRVHIRARSHEDIPGSL